LPHTPRQRQGAPLIDRMDHQCHTAMAHDTAIHHQHERLAGSMCQQDLRIRSKVHLLQDALVVEPSGKAFDAALGLMAIRDLRRDVGQLRALPSHDPTDECRERCQVPGDSPCRLTRIPLCSGGSYGTIPAEVVTHCLLLLDGSLFPESIQ
jgi:hypothetical protein